MNNTLLDLGTEEKKKAIDALIEHSSPQLPFFFMALLSVLMTTFGILKGNSAVVIGGALIAPLLYPILSLSMGIVMTDQNLLNRSLNTLIRASLYGLAVSFLLATLFKLEGGNSTNSQLTLLTSPSLLDAAIAVIAGLAVSFATVKSALNEALPGVAIAVTLVPPLSAIGVGLANFDWNIASTAFVTLALNVVGIVLTSVTVFSLMNFHTMRKEADRVIREEEREFEKVTIGNTTR